MTAETSPESADKTPCETAIARSPLTLFSLPEELLTEIILHLKPHEAIFLSLTCRELYYGVLSEHNTYLWYAIGAFDTHDRDPCPSWLESIVSHMPYLSRGPTAIATLPQSIPDFDRFCAGLEYIVEAMHDVTPIDSLIAPGRTAKSVDRHYRAPPREPPPAYQAGWYYKRVLVGTMLGFDDFGCQWCLRTWWLGSPPKVWRKLNMRLCNDCFNRHMLPMQILDRLPVDINTRLKSEEWQVTQGLHWDGLSDLSGGRIWRHKVERVIREVMGVNLDEFLKKP